MKNKNCPTIFCILFILLIVINPTDVNADKIKLKQLAEEYRQAYIQKNSEAKAIAQNQGWQTRVEFPDGKTIELQSFSITGRPLFYITHNAISAQSISTDEIHPSGSSGYNMTGSGITLHEWDGGFALTTHQELTGRVTIGDAGDSPVVNAHATHVAGTLIASGVDTDAKGMSYQADLVSFDWNSDTSEMATAAAEGAIISNHSYGFGYGWDYNYFGDGLWAWLGDLSVSTTEDNWFGLYTTYSEARDQIAYNAPYYLMFQSAGNDRNDSGPTAGTQHWVYDGDWVYSTDTRDADGPWDCLGTTAVAKNLMTVGAVEDIPFGYTNLSDVSATSFSSWGPPDDGRIKPDIVANGSYLKSCVSPGNTDYDWYSGTSMSSPSAAGSAGLIQEYYNSNYRSWMLSSSLKGLIIHTADEAGPNDGPDYMYGWGLMNTERAIEYIDHRNESVLIIEDNLSNGETYQLDVQATGLEELKATLCWTDLPGNPPSSTLLNPSTPMLVNDLDMRITKTGFTGYPWKLDVNNPANAATNNSDNAVDNVEQILVNSPTNDIYTITIAHKGTLASDQTFSLIVSGLIIDPPEIAVSPTSLTVNMGEDETELHNINIENTGVGNLYYSTNLNYLTREDSGNEERIAYPDRPAGMISSYMNPIESSHPNSHDRTDATISYDDDFIGYGIGAEAVASFICIARFTSDELAAYYDGYALKSIQFVINNTDFSNVTLKVYSGGSPGNPGTEIYTEDVTSEVVAGGWTTIELSSPILLESSLEYWIGYSIDATADHPAGCGSNSAVAGKGDVLYWGGWTTLSDNEVDWNWHIRGVLTPSWLKITANEIGTIAGSGRDDLDVTLEFNSTGMTIGTIKTAELEIHSNDLDESLLTIPITLNVSGSVPDAPINLAIVIVGGNAQLTWESVAGATSYNIYSDIDPEGSFSTLEASGIIPTNWTDTSPGNDKKFYIIKAIN